MNHNAVTVPQIDFGDAGWLPVLDGNMSGAVLFDRHYSKYHYADGRRPKLFVGPGQKVVLITSDGKALFVWRKFFDRSGQTGVNCSIFRNEGPKRSSDLILEAERIAAARWPGERLYTYVNPRAVKSANPGYCFKMAGWRICGITSKRKLLILEKVV